MTLFGFVIISKEEYKRLQKSDIAFSTMIQCHRWFAGWKDLDIIWNYILGYRIYGGISETREDYANARKTDVYGNIKK